MCHASALLWSGNSFVRRSAACIGHKLKYNLDHWANDVPQDTATRRIVFFSFRLPTVSLQTGHGTTTCTQSRFLVNTAVSAGSVIRTCVHNLLVCLAPTAPGKPSQRSPSTQATCSSLSAPKKNRSSAAMPSPCRCIHGAPKAPCLTASSVAARSACLTSVELICDTVCCA
jgi:hypothetical protein